MKRTTQDTSPDLLDGLVSVKSNLPEWRVSELSQNLKRMVEDNFGYVRVRGEIGECKHHSSGHLYLSLKDENAVLAAVCWRGQVTKLGLRPEIGMEVVCTGRLTTYMGQSKYQLVIETMALAGAGALLKMLEERRQRLAAEGLFDPKRKKALPFLPELIGVVTSPTGAVIRDILHCLSDRFPRDLLLWPVAVQGEGAAAQIAEAIRGFNALPLTGAVRRPDLLIVARGGGSVEDLMPFNEEVVVRAASDSQIPLISAVGHETDTTLIDYAADVRAPTPTAAAEMAVPVRLELLAQTAQLGGRLGLALQRYAQDRREKLSLTARSLGDPMRVLEPLSQRLDEKADRLIVGWRAFVQRKTGFLAEFSGKIRKPEDVVKILTQKLAALSSRADAARREIILRQEKKLERLATMLDVLSPRAVLGRGYALVYDAAGALVTSVKQLKEGDAVKIELSDGTGKATIQT
jgi:exodeoxyribonuclease VII large subunit